jgi:hypothetical protein
MIGIDQIRELLSAELARIQDVDRREALRSLLVEPTVEMREWDYGEPGERFPCWIVAVVPDYEVKLAYCDQGFGPADPWGAVFVPETSIGMDSQWHATLDDVFRAFGWRSRRGAASRS